MPAGRLHAFPARFLIMRYVTLPAVLLLQVASIPLCAQQAEYTGPGFTRTELAPGVFAFVFDNPLGDAAGVDGTSVVIVNDDDVVVVDAQWTPATSRRVIAEIRRITSRPVRYVVNTHWHGDHWFGNQAYRDTFPGVEFVAHLNTLRDLEEQELSGFEKFRDAGLPAAIADREQRYARGVRSDGRPYTSADSAMVRRQIAALKWAVPAVREIVPVTPTLTITDSLVLHRGERTIVIRYLGRGNTRGDLAVWLPRERVLVTGDLLVNPAPYSFGSYLGEWIGSLRALRALPAGVIVPGHGAIQRDWAYLDLVVELLESTLAQAKAAVAKGLDLEATRKAVDLAALRERFTRGDVAIGRSFDAFFIAPAVERAWLEARGELDKRAGS
jgi:glyoxylase-like metal-dependent hydrolase (beta-lactamase superfamily II)